MLQLRHTVLTAALAVAGFGTAFAQEIPLEGPIPTTALIRAESKSNAPLDPAALKLEVNGHGTPIESITAVRSGTAQVAILIDDGLRGSFGTQLEEVKRFVNDLPPGVQVLIGYMQNGSIRSSGHFSTNHGEVLGDLRIPFSSAGMNASPYFCLSEFVKHWPSSEPAARFVLMITNGVDPYNGSVSITNQNSPYVETAQNDAQRAGVAVYSIYYGDSGMRGQAASFSGQSYLQQVGDATGGQSLYNGTISPPSILPYFKMFNRALAESYIVGFRASSNHSLARIKLKSSQSGVKLHVPDGVRPGTSE